MSQDQARTIEAQQKQIKLLTRELQKLRQVAQDAYELIPNKDQSTAKMAKNAIGRYLESRNLLKVTKS